MQPNYYLDIRILDSADDGELTLTHLRNQIYSIVHGAFRKMPEKFALALEISPRQQRKMLAKEAKYNHPITPNYDVLRIFASEQDDLDQLVERIKGHWKIRDYAVLNHPVAVPIAKVTGWRCYFRFRLPTLKAEPNFLKNYPERESLHTKRLNKAKKLPYFKVISQSTGQSFTVPIEIFDINFEEENFGLPENYKDVNVLKSGLPDGYGLARKQHAFALPVFEV